MLYPTFADPLRPHARFGAPGRETIDQHASYEHANHHHGFAQAWLATANSVLTYCFLAKTWFLFNCFLTLITI
jgi:hypothetical protein